MLTASALNCGSYSDSKFLNAAIGIDSWNNALTQFANHTGSSRAQLVGIDKNKSLVFHSVTELPMQARVNFTQIDGNNPKINTRLMASKKYAPMHVVGDFEYEEIRQDQTNHDYREYCDRWEMQYGCQTNLIKDNEFTFLLMALRNRKDGIATPETYAKFQEMANEVRIAVNMARQLENQGEKLLSNSLDSMSINAFICNSNGAVCAKTKGAEKAIVENQILDLKNNFLIAKSKEDQKILDAAIAKAVKYGAQSAICLKGDNSGNMLLLEINLLPQLGWNFNFLPKIIIKIRDKYNKNILSLLQSAYDLTPAEAQVALMFANGNTREYISQKRNSSLQTVRTQLKSIFDKLDIHREAELAAKITLFM